MTVDELIQSLALPEDSRVNQRVPKKHLLENGAQTAADKRCINDGIEELMWVAALKPTNIGILAYRDDVCEYLEIAILSAALRAGAKTSRIVELIHRAIPYPVFLLTSLAKTVTISFAHKRWSQVESQRVVLEDGVVTAVLAGAAEESAFIAALPPSAVPRMNLHALYQQWIDAVTALAAARLTGSFVVTETPDAVLARRSALLEHETLTRDISSLRARAGKESQLNRRVELNLQLKQLEARLARVITAL